MIKKIFICSQFIVLFFLILSCENLMPDANDGVSHKNVYTVAYFANGGTGEMKSSVFTVGASENLPPNAFTKEGYVFTGWAVSADGDVEYADMAKVKDLAASGETVSLYAKWGINAYTVAYDSNGGEGHITPNVFTLGQYYALAANSFIRKGYTFAGWAISADGDVEYADKAEVQDLSYSAGGTVMLYAVWKPITYTIKYKANGGDGDMEDSVFTYDEPQELRSNVFILDAYVFAGWSASAEGDVVYANEDSVLNLTTIQGDTITLYAKWGKNIYTVSYAANGGSGYMAPGIVTLGQDYTLAANTFTREGYFFIGWSLLNNGEIHLEDEAVIQNEEDITGKTIRFYAVWLPEMVVTWPVAMYAAYGQTLSDLWLPDDAYSKVSGTFTWAAPDDPVGNVGVRLHRMIFTPDDLVHYNVVTQDVGIIVYPKFVDITGTQGRAIIPFDGADTLYGKTSTIEITLDGLLNGDTVTLTVWEGCGLSLSGNTGIGNNTKRTINVSYDGTTKINGNSPVSFALYISGNDNYILSITSGFEITIFDGQAESRAVPVTQANIAAFNSYANTENGLARHYKLIQNITNYPGNWEPIGTNDAPFTGSFDGNAFTISNLIINRTADYQGIFGYIGAGGAAKNIGVVNCNVSGVVYTGGVAGYNNGTIQNSYVSGSVSGDIYTGGVAGYNNGTIQNCYGTSSVSGGSYIGGVAGLNKSVIQNCYATGRINGTNYIGGIVGLNNPGTIQNCTALNSIITTSGGVNANIGRVAGSVSGGFMYNNYARADMSVKHSWNGISGTGKNITTTGIHNGIDGSGISPAQYTTQSWWITADNWYTGGAWNFTDIWAMNVKNIPRLRTAGGTQNHEFPIGDGTEANPFRVYNEATLKKVGAGTDGWSLDKHYLQIQDIALALPMNYQSNWTAIGTYNAQFTGVYDGGGYIVLNLYNISDTAAYQGLFGSIGRGGLVKNLGLTGGRTSGISSNSKSGGCTGGMAGENYGTVQNCYITGSVSSYNYVGGVVGYNFGTVQNCYTTGSVNGASYYVGGVVGANNGTVQNCYTTGSVNGSNYVGGVAGENYGTVQNCYAMGSVNGSNSIGGVVGVNYGTVQNCSALNSIVTESGSASAYIGRVSGYDSSDNMSNNYARGDMTVRYSWNGSAGTNKTVNAGLTTTDGENIGPDKFNTLSWWQNMVNWTTGGVWNFTNIWEMNGNNLPRLKNVGGVQDHLILNGDGTETNPLPVYDADTLQKIGTGIDGWSLNKHYKQVQNITLQSNWTPIGTNAGQFTGSFDGNGFTISNLTINNSSNYQGMFGYIGTGGMVKNIGLINGSIKGGNYTGGVAGYSSGTVQNCYVSGSVSGGAYTGGVAGTNTGTVQNCYVTGSVSGVSNVGGVAGQNSNMVQNCYAAGNVSGNSNVGGVAGSGGTVRNCVALNPNVTTSGNSGTVGRVLGMGSGSNNYARSDMSVRYNWNGIDGTNKTINEGLTTADGAKTDPDKFKALSWWQTTANWYTANGASAWNFTSIWVMNVNNLPMLRIAGGAQNHALVVYVGYMEMVWIPAGSFTMGSPVSEENRFEDEGPRHTVTMTGFYMGKCTVTQEQYKAVTGTNPSGIKRAVDDENVGRLPVEMVTWYDAVEFCNKLSQLEGLTPVYTISGRTPATGYPITGATVTANLSTNGFRLPTEAQWEYACRAGTTTAFNNGADVNEDTVWYNENSGNMTHEVGNKLKNAWGLYDMHGNVWEWCWDWFGNYTSGAQTNPTGASSGVTRVNRGGSWYSSAQGIRSACRNADLPSSQYGNLGFRVVRP
jgi:uncharacterized repeat protein (TIGR02543 family)